MALSSDGEVFTWGCGREGQLGLGDLSSPRSPQLVHSLLGCHVLQVSAGEYHSAALAADNLYTWGDNAEGQCGIEGGILRQCEPCANNTVRGSDVLQVRHSEGRWGWLTHTLQGGVRRVPHRHRDDCGQSANMWTKHQSSARTRHRSGV